MYRVVLPLLLLLILPAFCISVRPIDQASMLENHYTRSADEPKLELTYYSNWNATHIPVNDSDHIAGDAIVLVATWTPASLVNHTMIEVNATAIDAVISNEHNSSQVEINTKELRNNATCTINVTAWLTNGSIIHNITPNVFLGNFFRPHVRLLSPDGGEVWTGTNNITWMGWDNNTEDELLYDVYLSADSGQNYQPLSSKQSQSWYEWDCSGFLNLSTYVVRVEVTDGVYSSSDKSSSTFTAGEITETTTTSTSTTTTTTSPTTTTGPSDQEFVTALFISAAIISSAIMALVVYYAAKRWF